MAARIKERMSRRAAERETASIVRRCVGERGGEEMRDVGRVDDVNAAVDDICCTRGEGRKYILICREGNSQKSMC